MGLAPLLLLLAPERERSGVYFAWVILRRLTVTDACPKHREAALSNVVYSHLPLRYSSADEDQCSSTPATLAAACDVMRIHPSSAWNEMTPIHEPLRQAPHHLNVDALGGRPGVGE